VLINSIKFDYRIIKTGKDPRDTQADSFPVYHAYEPEKDIPAFPMHDCCCNLLTRCLATKETSKIDKDILHEVMLQNKEELARELELDYGQIEGPEQFWECHAGEEWAVADPAAKPGVEEVVKSMLPAKLFEQPSASSLDLGHKVRHDALTVLPYDVLHGIFAQLSIKDTLSLLKASWHVFDSTRDPAFWKLMIRLHIIPFFWELDGLLKTTTFPNTFDWRGAFQWLDEITKGTFGMEGPLMSIANRRRIWGVCQQIAPMYYEKLHKEIYPEPSEDEATAVISMAKSFHTPITMFPLPTEPRTIQAQFIRSWSEIKYRACDLDTYWTQQYGHLIGISVDFGSSQRVFGSTQGVKGQGLHIRAGDWIQEIKISFHPISLNGNKERSDITGREDARAVSEAAIDGMKVRQQLRTDLKDLVTDSMLVDCPDFWGREENPQVRLQP
jgi:hypothetical protein